MIRVGVIGFGYWGPKLAAHFVANRTFDLRLICDHDETMLERARQLYPRVDVCTTSADVFSTDLDAVAIATPANTHYQLGKQALRAGLHVLMEKPLALGVLEATDLVELAELNELMLMVDHTYLYAPAVRDIKKRIERGELGELLYIDSVRLNPGLVRADINVLWDLLTHDLSILRFWTEQEIRWISTDAVAVHREHLHQAYVSLGYDAGLFGHAHVNWHSPVKIRRMMVGGTEGLIVYDDLSSNEKIRLYAPGMDLEREEALIDYRSSDVQIPRIDSTEPLQAVCQAFGRAIESGEPPLSDGAFGLEVVRQLTAAQESVDLEGRRQPVCT